MLWQAVLGEKTSQLNGAIERIAEQFSLGGQNLAAAGAEALARAGATRRAWLSPYGRPAAAQARPRLDDLAQRIEPAATWDDLVLPDAAAGRSCSEIAAHVRQRSASTRPGASPPKRARGLGHQRAVRRRRAAPARRWRPRCWRTSCDLDLYRIDLSSGRQQVHRRDREEPAPRLRRRRSAAAPSCCSTRPTRCSASAARSRTATTATPTSRSATCCSAWRAYRGLAILTTNLKNALDHGLPAPDPLRRAVPVPRRRRSAPRSGGASSRRDADRWPGLSRKLARLNVAGGNIRNIALNAAFLAADAGEPVQHAHLLHAAHSEYAKLEKALTEGEIKGWV